MTRFLTEGQSVNVSVPSSVSCIDVVADVEIAIQHILVAM